MKQAIPGFFVAVALLACAPPTPGAGEQVAIQREGAWALASLPGASASAPQPTLTIAGDELSGFTGCNSVSATIESDPNVAAFFRSGPSATEMACEAPAMEMERVFLEALSRTGDARVEGRELVFYDVDNREIRGFAAIDP